MVCKLNYQAPFSFLLYFGQVTDILIREKWHDLAIFFEDLMSDPERECRKLFQQMGISAEFVPSAMEALKQDSQKGTFGQRGRRPKISADTLTQLESYLGRLEIDPRITCTMSPENHKELILSKLSNKKL